MAGFGFVIGFAIEIAMTGSLGLPWSGCCSKRVIFDAMMCFPDS
jgi:hypothetical protein